MKKLILLTILCFYFLLSSNIFALPFSYPCDAKNPSATIIYLKSGNQLNLADVFSDGQSGASATNDNIFYDDLYGTTTSTENTSGGGTSGVTTVPEPLTLILFSMGLAGIAMRRRKS